MCRQTTCRTCQKPSWAGCGAHVEQVLAHVPKAERCQGHTRAVAAAAKAAGGSKPATSLIDRLRRLVQK